MEREAGTGRPAGPTTSAALGIGLKEKPSPMFRSPPMREASGVVASVGDRTSTRGQFRLIVRSNHAEGAKKAWSTNDSKNTKSKRNKLNLD